MKSTFHEKKNRSWYKFNIRKYFPKSANRRICSLYVKVPGGGFLFCLLLEKCLFFMKTTNDILVSSGFLSWLLVKKKKVQSAYQGVFYPHDVVAIQQRDQVSEQWMACLDSY